MERSPLVAATQSVADFLPPLLKNVYGGYPKWQVLPENVKDSALIVYLLLANSAPGDFDRYFSRDGKDLNTIIWYKDHMGDTIRGATSWVKKFIEEEADTIAEAKVRFRLASGNIGMLAAVNETVKESQFLNFVLVMSVVFLLCSLTYRSMVAAVILMIPLNLANLITLSIMKALGIGLNINTLPIVSVGVGVGIDYGIYLLSRLCEEYQHLGGYSLETATAAIKTTGKAIFFTATTMIAGVIFWYFLSSLRFQAEMGLLLALVMFINMVGALILIPSLVYVFKPKFLGRATLLIKE
jgi:predicted RND superfamily exporter protein